MANTQGNSSNQPVTNFDWLLRLFSAKNVHAWSCILENRKYHKWVIAVLITISSYILANFTIEIFKSFYNFHYDDTPALDKKVTTVHQWGFLARGLEGTNQGYPSAGQYGSANINANLHGIVAIGAGTGAAMISLKGGDIKVYGIGDSIADATLIKIEHNRVLLDWGGDIQELTMPVNEADVKLVDTESLTKKPTDKEDTTARVYDAGARRSVAEIREIAAVDPTQLLEKIAIEPKLLDSGDMGYQVALVKDKELFENLGIRDGDVLKSVEGIPIQDLIMNKRKLMSLLSAGSATLLLERDRSEQEITINLD